MKTRDEIQRAHDILTAFIVGDVPHDLTAVQMTQVMGNCEALCWILGHQHNPTFADNLRNLEEGAARAGYALHDTGEVKVRGPRESADSGVN